MYMDQMQLLDSFFKSFDGQVMPVVAAESKDVSDFQIFIVNWCPMRWLAEYSSHIKSFKNMRIGSRGTLFTFAKREFRRQYREWRQQYGSKKRFTFHALSLCAHIQIWLPRLSVR